MVTSVSGLDKPGGSAQPGSVFTWIATILACVYFLYNGVSLYYATGIFINMFASMAVDLPLSTRLLIANYRWLCPILFGGTATLVITKQFYVRQKWISVSITLAAALAALEISNGIARVLYLPLLDYMQKLNR